MTLLATEVPYTLYFDRTGAPLDGGYVYFGVENEDPQTNPITVYWDAAGTQPVAQPVRTQAGFPVRAGSIAEVYCANAYSVTVLDATGRLVRYSSSSQSFSLATFVTNFITNLASSTGSSLVGFLQSGANTIARFVMDKLCEQRSVLDYMTQAQIADVTSGTGSIDVTAALQEALNANSTRRLLWPDGKYKVTSTAGNDALAVPRYCRLEFQSQFGAVIDATGVAAGQAALYIFGNQFNLCGLRIIGSGTQIGVKVHNGYIARYEDGYMVNLAYGLQLDEAGSCVVTNWNFENCGVGIQAAGGSAYVFEHCDFNTAGTVGVQSAISTISGAGSSVTTRGCRFATGTGVKMPANSTLSYYSEGDYFEGTPSTNCSPYQIGTTGTGTIITVSIQNAQVANTNNVGSSFANVQYMRCGGSYWGQPRNIAASVQNFAQAGFDWFLLSAYDANSATNAVTMSSVDGSLGASKVKTTGLDNTTAGQARYALQAAAQGFDMLSDRFRPIVDNAMHIGDSSHRAIDVYAVNGTIQTSDQREKTDIKAIPPEWLAAWRDVQWTRFHRLSEPAGYSEAGKWHIGAVAQQVVAAFAAHGVDATQIGLVTHDTWTDEEGQQHDRYGIRYEEALSLEIALMRSRLEALEAKP